MSTVVELTLGALVGILFVININIGRIATVVEKAAKEQR